MSMPYSLLDCPACGYGASTTCLWGYFVYRDGAGTEAFIRRRLGWCHDCRRAVPLEMLPDAGLVEAERAAAQQQIDAHAPVQPTQPATRFRWLRDLLPRLAESEDLRKARAELLRTELLAAVLAAARGPRCLTCGSQSVEPIPLPDPNTLSPRHDLLIDFRHPGCEPPMRFWDAGGNRMAIVPTKRVYDVQGQFIGHVDPPRRR